MRINRYIAGATGMSRRQVDSLIKDGSILLNNQPAQLGDTVNPGDTVHMHGRLVEAPPSTQPTLIMLNKPLGYVCSRAQQGSARTVYDLLPTEYHHLKTIGRLDKDSSGLLLLSDDGALIHSLTHPSFNKDKSYEVTLDRPLTPNDREAIVAGVMLEDGTSALGLRPLESQDKWLVRMHEGRNRQIRRTFQALNYRVYRLHRIRVADYTIGNLELGKFIKIL